MSNIINDEEIESMSGKEEKKTKNNDKRNTVPEGSKGKCKDIFKISGICIAVVFLVIAVVFMVMVHKLGMVPATYELLAVALLMLIGLLTLLTQRWRVPGIITKIIALLMSVVLVVGCVYVNATYSALKKMSGDNTVSTTVRLYVLSDSGIDSIDMLSEKKVGKLASIDAENTQKLINHIEEDARIALDYVDYDGFAELIDALFNKEVSAIILNESYTGVLSEIPGYADFEARTKSIYDQNYVTVIETEPVKDEVADEDNVISFYISGIDTRTGGVNSNSNSDVNILCFVNLKTHQVLLLNTPRDFYVPTSVSNGELDKLTHAGCYGINCSVKTLEMLYDVNIDYYIKVNFTGFVDIINKLGGVEVYSEYAFKSSHSGEYIQKGMNYFTGEQALAFARERYAFGSGDRQRGKNQMAVIEALIKKMASSALLANYSSILDSVSSSVATNMPYEKIGELAQMQLNEMPTWDVVQYSANGSGDTKSTFSYKPKVYVMIPDQTTVNNAKSYIAAMHNDEIISVK